MELRLVSSGYMIEFYTQNVSTREIDTKRTANEAIYGFNGVVWALCFLLGGSPIPAPS